jgi:hypothetical protein
MEGTVYCMHKQRHLQQDLCPCVQAVCLLWLLLTDWTLLPPCQLKSEPIVTPSATLLIHALVFPLL